MSWWQTAKVGDKVVALVDRFQEEFGSSLVRGKVYSIAEIIDDPEFQCEGCSIYINIGNSPPGLGWSAKRFRPVAPLDKRMDELRGLLDPESGPWGPRVTAPEKVPA